MFNKYPKKLKRIPYDTVSYIQIEAEGIQDLNDKQMIASYCLGKLEMVNWYIDLVKSRNEKYIVPQSLTELEHIRAGLEMAYKQVMAVKVKKSSDWPLLDIKYPKGYDG